MLGNSGAGQYGQFPGGAAGQLPGSNTASALAALGQAGMGGNMPANFATLANLQAAGRWVVGGCGTHARESSRSQLLPLSKPLGRAWCLEQAAPFPWGLSFVP